MRSRAPLPLVAAVAVLGLLGGLGVSRVLGSDADESVPTTAGADRAQSTAADSSSLLVPLPEPGAPIPVEAATDPRTALEGYLTAEANGDYRASYAFLTIGEQREFGSPAAWAQAHGAFWPITGYRIEHVEVAGAAATAETLTGYDARLDPVVGLIPARAHTVWMLVEEPGGWRVAVGESTQEALYPPDESAAGVAERWAAARAACASGEQWQVELSLVGTPVLAERLCDAGRVQLGGVEDVRETDDITGLVAAYGPDVLSWARVVRVTAPEQMGIVLAPIGADWRVMGVIGPGLGA